MTNVTTTVIITTTLIGAGNNNNNNNNIRESYTDYIDPRFPKSLFVLLILFGVSGNLLSLAVFSSSSMKSNSIFTYLAYLSVVDLFVIVFGLGDLVLIAYAGFVVRNHSLILCRLHTFATYFFSHLSSFILASVSLDRAIALNLTNFARSYCLPRTAHAVVLLDALIVLAINCHTLFFLGTHEHTSHSNETATDSSALTTIHFTCSPRQGSNYDKFLEPYFEWIDLMSYAIVPFLVMVVCTFFIVKVVFKSYNNQKRLSSVSIDYDLTNGGVSNMAGGCHHHGRRSIQAKNSHRKKNISYTLISLNVLFFALVSPLLFLLAFLSGAQNVREYQFLIDIVYILAYSNHCLNFIFYGLSSPPYRRAVKILLNIKR